MFEQPKWFTDLKPKDDLEPPYPNPPASQEEVTANIEDRVTALEELLDAHGIRPK